MTSITIKTSEKRQKRPWAHQMIGTEKRVEMQQASTTLIGVNIVLVLREPHDKHSCVFPADQAHPTLSHVHRNISACEKSLVIGCRLSNVDVSE